MDIPDFEEMLSKSKEIQALSNKKRRLTLEINLKEAEVVSKVASNPQYYVNGKPPSMDYIKTTYLVTGLTGELIPLREELIEVTCRLGEVKSEFDLMKSSIDIYRTESANKRAILN
jgi:hypothetical protein